MLHIEPGQRIGRLIVVQRVGTKGSYKLWRCRCDCGTEKDITAQLLRRGSAQSCGCLQAETRANGPNFRHGLSNTPTYRIWKGMWNRCRLVHRADTRVYAQKGIAVCERWRSFENFLADMGERPPGKSIERQDSNGNYSPDNCVWATPKEQRANSSQRIHYLSHQGATLPIGDWAQRLGLNPKTVYARFKRGLPTELVLAKADLRL